MGEKLRSSFWKLRHFALSKQESKEPAAAIDEGHLPDVAKCVQDALDMRIKYEGLLTNGQIISGAAYDFSRTLQDMASYMVESFGDVVDQEIGNIFSLLAKVQFEMSKLLDLFAAHVSKAIIKPTELMMDKIQQAEIMKDEYDEKRKLYILSRLEKHKGKSKKGKGSMDHQQTIMAEKSIQEQGNFLTLYIQALKRGQLEDLVTQAVKYHSAHMHLFSKGLASINAVEPMIRQIAQYRVIDRTWSEEEASIDEFMNSSDLNRTEKVQENDSGSDSTASSSRHLLVEQIEPPGNLSDSSEEFYPRRSAVNSKSAPVSPLTYPISETTTNILESLPDSGHESVTRYALPSPLNESRRQAGSKTSKILPEKHVDLHSNKMENFSPDILEISKVKLKPDVSVNQPLPQRDQFEQEQQHEYSITSDFPHERLDDFPCESRDDFADGTRDFQLNDVQKGRGYTQSGPLIDSPSYGKYRFANVRRISPSAFYEDHTSALYKSGPIRRSPHLAHYIGNSSPPTSAIPHISELHKLPLPPPGSVTPPKSPNRTRSPITYSAPLGKVKHMSLYQSGQVSPPPT